MAIWRLLFVCVLFLGYGGAAFYFNAYVHSINEEAVTMLFSTSKRNIYPTTVGLFTKEVANTGNKRILSHNPGIHGLN